MRLRRARKNEQGVYLLQLTSMVDMFTIILVFLLKSYSTSAYQITPADQVELPLSKSQQDPEEGVKVVLSPKTVSVEDQILLEWSGENGWKEYLHQKNKGFLPRLHTSLQKQAETARALQEANSELAVKGRLILQVDKNVSYALVKTVMATAAVAGFSDFHLLTLKE